MDKELFFKIVDDLKKWESPYKIKVMRLFGVGEPFLNKNFPLMLKTLRKENLAERLEVTSNVSLLDEEIIHSLVANELDYLRVSIYGTTAREYQETTRTSFPLAKIIDNLKKLKQAKKKLKTQKPTVGIKMFEPYEKEVRKRFYEIFTPLADEIFIERLHNWTAKDGYQERYYEKTKALKAREDLLTQNDGKEACPFPFYQIMIRTNGDVSMCCIDYQGHTVIGNVKEKNLKDIWQSEKTLAFYKMQLEHRRNENPACRDCNFFQDKNIIADNVDGFDMSKLHW